MVQSAQPHEIQPNLADNYLLITYELGFFLGMHIVLFDTLRVLFYLICCKKI